MGTCRLCLFHHADDIAPVGVQDGKVKWATELLPNARATAVSSFAFVLFLGQSVGAIFIGTMIAHAGYQAAFLTDGAAIVVFAFYLSTVLRRPAA